MTHRIKKLCASVSLWFFTGIFVFSSAVYANNVSVSNVTLTGQSGTGGSGYVMAQFDLSWENSWRMGTGEPSNWDAAWVFVKYQVGSGAWKHATLSATSGDHTAPSGSTITPSPDGKGVFIYRNADGTGTLSLSGAQLRWNYGADGVGDSVQVTVKVIAIEMVYVPTGSFQAGGAGSENSKFTLTTINTASASQSGGYPTGQTAPGSNNWPNGYNAFYCMKYEISQEQYVDFLNMLDALQQTNRTAASANAASGTKAMTTGSAYRNGIEIKTPAGGSAVYGCDLNDNGAYNESSDGQNVACNFLSWADGAAYCDWAALRPMTELEYEKACRGPSAAVADEYAWGSDSANQATGISNSGETSETASNIANCAYGYASGVQGPLRVGCFGMGGSGRGAAGATYYGIREMSGNLWERCVTIAAATGRAFTGAHGDGAVDSSGNANATNWPGTNADGAGSRGGNWQLDASLARVAARSYATDSYSYRNVDYGFRGVRLAH